MTRVESRLPPGDELAILAWREQFLLFAERPMVHSEYHASIKLEEKFILDWFQNRPRRWVLLPNDSNYSCFRVDRGESMGYAHGRTRTLLGMDGVDLELL